MTLFFKFKSNCIFILKSFYFLVCDDPPTSYDGQIGIQYLRLSLFLQLYFYFQILLLSNWILIVYLFWKVFISWFEVAKTHSIRNLIHLKNIPNQVTRVSWELRCYMVLKPFTIIFFFQILLLSNWILIVFLFFKYFYFRIEF